ncbi:unnamed protein product [Peronospora destructor]|uniref:PHD-type domain-containing protein n=1 Tax=Peronospora destructor TaxID=86335 RepID=A0AAV0T1Q3_9STRA|nr:unnamed protein product [Peronospora destructor]
MSKDGDTRAQIPALLSIAQQQQNKHLDEPQYRQRWGWQDDKRPKLALNEITAFVRTYAWPKETELALQCFFEASYDVTRAVETLHKARRQKLKLNREATERVPTTIFEKVVGRHGKNFHLVKRRLGRNVTTQEVVSKFYLWKTTPEYKKWHNSQREKKRKREAKRLKQLCPAVDQHREYCEVCLKGGKLLCCDGCERACHLNCVRPALLDVPEGEWFCLHCREVAPSPAGTYPGSDGSKPTLKAKTKANDTSLKWSSDLQLACCICNDEKKIDEKYPLTIEKYLEKSESTACSKHEGTPNRFITEDLDDISDITTESESDGGVAKAIQSLTSKHVFTAPSKKRNQKCSKLGSDIVRPRCKSSVRFLENESSRTKDVREKVLPLRKQKNTKNETVVGRPRYSCPALSLEYCSSQVKPIFREVKPLQLKTVSSGRKRKRRFDASCNSPHLLP